VSSKPTANKKPSPPPPAGDHDVLVLDDNAAIRTALERLLVANGYRVRVHHEPEDFLATGLPAGPACLLLDNQLGDGMSGLQVHAEIVRLGWNLPVIFLTAHWNVQSVVSAIRAGADGFLTKPYDPDELLRAVAEALVRAQAADERSQQVSDARARAETLTERERQIVCLVIRGKLNKEIATEIKLAEPTVKLHRGRAMVKLGAGNPAELVRIAQAAGIFP
jgi:FixJ family two-component response regulator